jgi:hypothetical protein
MFSIRLIKSNVTSNGTVLHSATCHNPNEGKKNLFLNRYFIPYPKGAKVEVDSKEMLISSVEVEDGIIKALVVTSPEDKTGYTVALPTPTASESNSLIETGTYFGREKDKSFVPLYKLDLDNMRYYNIRKDKWINIRCMNKFLREGDNVANYVAVHMHAEIFLELGREAVVKGDYVTFKVGDEMLPGQVTGYPDKEPFKLYVTSLKDDKKEYLIDKYDIIAL